MSNNAVKEAKKVNQSILSKTKYNKEATQQKNNKAKASPTIEELQNV
jgi:hypothetical protein